MKCLEREVSKTYTIAHRGYGSKFDNFNTQIDLCDNCNETGLELWTNEIPTKDHYGQTFHLEDLIEKFVDTLPKESQDKFWQEDDEYREKVRKYEEYAKKFNKKNIWCRLSKHLSSLLHK